MGKKEKKSLAMSYHSQQNKFWKDLLREYDQTVTTNTDFETEDKVVSEIIRKTFNPKESKNALYERYRRLYVLGRWYKIRQEYHFDEGLWKMFDQIEDFKFKNKYIETLPFDTFFINFENHPEYYGAFVRYVNNKSMCYEVIYRNNLNRSISFRI